MAGSNTLLPALQQGAEWEASSKKRNRDKNASRQSENGRNSRNNENKSSKLPGHCLDEMLVYVTSNTERTN